MLVLSVVIAVGIVMVGLAKKSTASVAPVDYYSNWDGHIINNLAAVLAGLRATSKPVAFLAGDSTVDNKYWLVDSPNPAFDRPEAMIFDPDSYVDKAWIGPAVGGYETVLSPPNMLKDVAYWMTVSGWELADNFRFSALNTAVEATFLAGRSTNPTPQDEFIKDNIGSEDFLVVSVGGNDFALNPTQATQMATSQWFQGQRNEALNHFHTIYNKETVAYVEYLTSRVRPRAIFIASQLFPGVQGTAWAAAEAALTAVQYSAFPEGLQGLIMAVYNRSIVPIEISGTQVVPFPLFEALDGTVETDYAYRVEPSLTGGEKFGRALTASIHAVQQMQTLTSTQEEITCGVVKASYRSSGCCGNPNKKFVMDSNRRLHAESDTADLERQLVKALEHARTTGGTPAAQAFARKLGAVFAKHLS